MAVLCIHQSEETPHIDEDSMDRENSWWFQICALDTSPSPLIYRIRSLHLNFTLIKDIRINIVAQTPVHR